MRSVPGSSKPGLETCLTCTRSVRPEHSRAPSETASGAPPGHLGASPALLLTSRRTIQWGCFFRSGRPYMSDVTQILSRIESGDPSAAEQLLPLIYEELRKLAAGEVGTRASRTHVTGHGIGARGVSCGWSTPKSFSIGILVDTSSRPPPRPCDGSWSNRRRRAESKARRRAGTGELRSRRNRCPGTPSLDLLAIHEALALVLRSGKELKADLVKLRYFAGFYHSTDCG